jgi:hypothetical protein
MISCLARRTGTLDVKPERLFSMRYQLPHLTPRPQGSWVLAAAARYTQREQSFRDHSGFSATDFFEKVESDAPRRCREW